MSTQVQPRWAAAGPKQPWPKQWQTCCDPWPERSRRSQATACLEVSLLLRSPGMASPNRASVRTPATWIGFRVRSGRVARTSVHTELGDQDGAPGSQEGAPGSPGWTGRTPTSRSTAGSTQGGGLGSDAFATERADVIAAGQSI